MCYQSSCFLLTFQNDESPCQWTAGHKLMAVSTGLTITAETVYIHPYSCILLQSIFLYLQRYTRVHLFIVLHKSTSCKHCGYVNLKFVLPTQHS